MLQMKMNIFIYLLHNIYFNTLIYTILTIDIFRHRFSAPPPPSPRHLAPLQITYKIIYFDLIDSYLIILTTKFVKLPILWSQISPCRPRKQILLNFFLGLSGRCHHTAAKASSSTPPDIYPPPPNENPSLGILGTTRRLLYLQYTEA